MRLGLGLRLGSARGRSALALLLAGVAIPITPRLWSDAAIWSDTLTWSD